MHGIRDPRSVDGVCDVLRWGDDGARATLVVEVPHGATLDRHFVATRDLLTAPPAEDLIAYFRVNTDFGAPEVADETALRLARADVAAIVVRGLVPRTLVDLNRDLDDDGAVDGSTGVTPGLPAYVRDPADRALLRGLWTTYRDVASSVYEEVCARNRGLALALHTYAPRSVSIERFDDDIVALLRHAYAPEFVDRWPLRPEADLILPFDDDIARLDDVLVGTLRDRLGAAGVEAAESATYRLAPGTMARRRAIDHPRASACLEIRRDLLGAPWRAFERSSVDPAAVTRVGAAIAEACVAALRAR